MFAEIRRDEISLYPMERKLTIVVDSEAAEVIKFFVSVLTGKDQAAKTDQENVAGR